MSDTDKIQLIGKIIADGLEYEPKEHLEGYYLALLCATTSVIEFGEEAE